MTALKSAIHIEAHRAGSGTRSMRVERPWGVGVKSFFAGLEEYVEAGRASWNETANLAWSSR